jgi:uncharacterized protein (DUF58 family)
MAWKKVAHTGQLVSRDREASAPRDLWLDDTAARTPDGDPERRLSRLTAWVLAADRAGLAVGMLIVGMQRTNDTGGAHRRTLLNALREWGEG